jgi:Ca2+-binding EF-hand superfamily protein
MINYMSKGDFQVIKERFQEIDIEHNGVITYNDLKTLMIQ